MPIVTHSAATQSRVGKGLDGVTTQGLTLAEKRAFHRDGFVILPGFVDRARVDVARRLIFTNLARPRPDPTSPSTKDPDAAAAVNPAVSPEIVGLFNDTGLRELIEEAMGPVDAARACQLASRFPSDPSGRVNESGYPDRDTPFLGWHGHLDGLWNGATPIHQDLDRPMTQQEADDWNREPSRNGCRKAFPELGANLRNFTALVAVALSDQTTEGAGNVGVLKGAHRDMERFFRAQRAAGGPLGPDGPNWERIHRGAPNGCGLRHYPDAIREAFADNAARTPDGKLWPRPTLLRLAPGDVAIILHALPHSATRVTGSEPRLMAYFRVSPNTRPEPNRAVYPDALCDIWHEWPGMADVVAAERS